MEYIILGILIVVLIILVILLVLMSRKNINESHITERLGKVETSLIKEIGEFKLKFSNDLTKDFIELNERVEKKLNMINDKVNERIEVNFEKTNKTFSNVLERLAKIDEAQKKIDGLSSDIVSLQGILTDKKTRGIFGEVNLYHILANVFGENNDRIYKTQYTLSNKFIADSVLFGPEPLGTICIDSKFPLEHYRTMLEKGITEEERVLREKHFEADVKKHIDDISEKYIIKGETSNQAIMFLPAEAIFAEINAYHSNIITYSQKRNVWIASPTTLISLLTIIQAVLMGIERDKYASVIHEELNKLGIEFDKYKIRWDKLSRSITTVTNDIKDINVTTDKISKRFDSISHVKIDEKDKSIEIE